MKTFAFKSPPSVVLCVDVVSCTGARRSLLSLCPRWQGPAKWLLIPMPYICTCIRFIEKHCASCVRVQFKYSQLFFFHPCEKRIYFIFFLYKSGSSNIQMCSSTNGDDDDLRSKWPTQAEQRVNPGLKNKQTIILLLGLLTYEFYDGCISDFKLCDLPR